MADQPVRDERTSYTVLLYRKNRIQRLIEIGLFLGGLLVALPMFEELRSLPFILTVLGWGFVVMAVVPAVLLVWKRPRYRLFDDRLVIYWGKQREEVALSQVKPAFEFPNQFEIEGRKCALLVTDDFLQDLNTQLELNKRGLKRRGQ
ncbi:hypothetical protein [Desmospora activa]|uniref:Uncharacterized protein n=1 Tax=Desmospora activa DSM 45169 TaxID=1121389 RepID=A0A2T4Z0R1_9BACL|nr:hypothetical protein [Desmospora activa]PTM53305.1 hypothetical protein C8J48_3629 [Desmospora activa DSM 45169]